MPAPGERLQALADALALTFAQGATSAACAASLGHLLPGLQYASLAVANPSVWPASSAALVAAANCAAAGHCTLHVHSGGSTAAGLALARRRPIAACLKAGAGGNSEEAGAGLLSSEQALLLADVQLLLATAPTVQLMLCVPFGCLLGSAASGCEAGSGCLQCGVRGSGSGCQQCGVRGSGSGALLLGLAGPGIDTRRLALLVHLAQCLPRPLARLSADTLALVNFACGTDRGMGQGGCCCCPEQGWEEEEEEEEREQGGSCFGGDKRGGSGDGSGSGPLALPVPRLAAVGEEAAGGAAGWEAAPASPSGPSMQPDLRPSTGTLSRASSGGACSDTSAGSASAGGLHGVSKGLAAAAAAEGGEALLQQSRLMLRFKSDLAEQEYGLWMAPHYATSDRFTAVVVLLAAVVGAVAQHHKVLTSSCAAACLCVAIGAPLLYLCAGVPLSTRTYVAWRTRLLPLLRMLAFAYVFWALNSAPQAQPPPWRLRERVAIWRQTGAEALFATAIGFSLPQWQHLPLQVAALGIAAFNLPHLCFQAYPEACPQTCLLQGLFVASALGCLLPTLLLRRTEGRSRTAFARLVRAAAGGT